MTSDSSTDSELREKWIVALTDGTDNMSDNGDVDAVVRKLQSTPKLNIALITIGDQYDKVVLDRFIDAAKGSTHKNQALHVQATNMQSISEAFERVAQSMAAGAGG